MSVDKISQRIIASCLGLSAIVLSLCLLVFTTSQTGLVQANDIEDLEMSEDWDNDLRGGVGLGTVDDTGYFVVWAKPNKLYKVDLDKATDWFAE
ncbi:hypothetical protein OAE48_03185 [Flavobacteriales bacterium]|nr:hypothetical protein [Flavobacteriales bacterium]